MSDTTQPDLSIKKETSDTPEVPETEEEKEEQEDKRKKDKEDEEAKKKEKHKRKKENGTAEEQSDDDSESKKKKENNDDKKDKGEDEGPEKKDDFEGDVAMDGVIQPLPEDEDEDSGSDDGGTSDDNSDSDGTLTDLNDSDFEDVRKNFPKDDNPEYRALEMRRRNYQLINETVPERGSTGRFIHKIRGHCATLGFIKKYGNANTLYLNQYGGIDAKKLSNRTWFRFESQAEDEEYERLAENDKEFQRVNSLQLKNRHASTEKDPYQLNYRFKKQDVISLSAAAWETDWSLIPWEKFKWKKIGLRSFEDARAKHDENNLSRDHLASILHFQVLHEINQIDPACQEYVEGVQIYVRTLWRSQQFPVSWETQSSTKRVYGVKLPAWIVSRSETNGQRYVEGVQDPNLLENRESSVGMDADGNTTYTESRGKTSRTEDAESRTSEKKKKKQHRLKPISRRSQSPEESDPDDDMTGSDSESEDGGGGSKSSNKKMMKMMKMIKELSFQVGALTLEANATKHKMADWEEAQKGKKSGGRRLR